MTQLDLINPCRVPPHGTQCHDIIHYLMRGGRLTVKKALDELGVYALSQRVGDLKRTYGWPIKSRMVEVYSGARVAEYYLEQQSSKGGEHLEVAA